MAEPADIKVRTAGALRTGLAACLAPWRAKGGAAIAASFTHGPLIEKELANGTCDADIVGLTKEAIEGAQAAGSLGRRTITIGSIQIGMAIRKGADRPPIVSLADFQDAVRAADTLIYTTAASGDYMASVFERLGLTRALAPKTERLDTGAKVNDRLLSGTAPKEIAFGVATELLAANERGVVYLGPLPRDIESATAYAFAPVSGRTHPGIDALLDFLGTEQARELFAATGVD
jgi:molybdate transport system substrate-binding protein